MAKRYYAGCDIGSTTGKVVVMDDEGIVASTIIPREVDPEETARKALYDVMASIDGISDLKDFVYLIGTGYGRAEIPFAHENISEISCHAMGAFYCNSAVKTIVDIGGQDIKGIAVDDDGSVLEFAMNDKCAAGTGRFYEAMSRIFNTDLESFSDLSLQAKKMVPVTAQCSVFAETEVISLLARKTSPSDVAAGIQNAVGKRCFTLLKRVGVRDKVTVTGGCAKNRGLIKELNRILKTEIISLSEDPQLMGALGAAIFARRKGSV
ncbi:MAG TPA: acyl-CoA dehydratase activase [Spirochaetota bacterium]|nr:acyl-CoA dehydratase activase [Spirochaetota bacterium]HPQ55026.1 acyl-CoA dehydratase activase [Spirochaetota bacterium]